MEEWKSTLNFLRDRVKALEEEVKRNRKPEMLLVADYEETLPVDEEEAVYKELEDLARSF